MYYLSYWLVFYLSTLEKNSRRVFFYLKTTPIWLSVNIKLRPTRISFILNGYIYAVQWETIPPIFPPFVCLGVVNQPPTGGFLTVYLSVVLQCWVPLTFCRISQIFVVCSETLPILNQHVYMCDPTGSEHVWPNRKWTSKGIRVLLKVVIRSPSGT